MHVRLATSLAVLLVARMLDPLHAQIGPPPSEAAAQAIRVPSVPVPMTPFGDGKAFMLNEAMTYRIGTTLDSVIVPAGFVTDLASIPSSLQSIVSPLGPHMLPAIVHDYLYWEQGCTRSQADYIFSLAMREAKVPYAERLSMLSALLIGGGPAYESNAAERRAGKPRVIPIEYRRIPRGSTWDLYREWLASIGIRPSPATPIPPAFCAWGSASADPPGVP